VDHQGGAGWHRPEQAGGQPDFLDLLVGEDADQDGLGAVGGLGDAGDWLGAVGGERGALVLGPG
jgi:hypothetical protein